MKIRVLSFFVSLLLLTSATVSVNHAVADTSFTPKSDVVLCDFEQWKPDFSTLRIGGDFGKITRSTDYVTSGKYSAKLQPGGPYSSSSPYFTIPLTSKMYGFKYVMSDYVAITGKFYNAEQKDVSMEVGLSFSKYGNKIPVKYTLKPGWNDISYMINHNIILMFNGSMEGVNSVFFRFEPSLSKDINDSAVIYADDIKLRAAQSEIVPLDIVELSPLEICDFERPYQEYVMSSWVYQETPPDYRIVDVRRGELPNGIVPTSGNCCLEMTLHARNDGNQVYPQAIITDNVVAKAINSLTQGEKSRAYIAFDIYSYTEANLMMDLGFKDAVSGGIDNLQPCDVLFQGYISAGKGWSTYRVKLTDIVRINGQGEAVSDFINNPSEIRFVWASFMSGGDRIVYLDNVRIELNAA